MVQLNASTTDYLLDLSLEALHEECKEWKEEIEFWKDELLFFQHLVTHKRFLHPDQSQHQKLSDNLVKLNRKLVSELDKEIIHHDDELKALTEIKLKMNVEIIRDHHKILKEKFTSFKRDYIELKKKLIAIEKKGIGGSDTLFKELQKKFL